MDFKKFKTDMENKALSQIKTGWQDSDKIMANTQKESAKQSVSIFCDMIQEYEKRKSEEGI